MARSRKTLSNEKELTAFLKQIKSGAEKAAEKTQISYAEAIKEGKRIDTSIFRRELLKNLNKNATFKKELRSIERQLQSGTPAAKMEEEIRKAWVKYKRAYADLHRRILKHANAELEKMGKSPVSTIGAPELNDTRYNEFERFFAAGMIADFDPLGTTPGYLEGDIKIKDRAVGKNASDVLVQLKGRGGELKVLYSLDRLESTINGKAIDRNTFKNLDNRAYNAIEGLMRNHLNLDKLEKKMSDLLEKDTQSIEAKVMLAELHARTSAAEWYVIEFPKSRITKKSGEGSKGLTYAAFSVAIPKNKLGLFVRSYPNLFRLKAPKRDAGDYFEQERVLSVAYDLGSSSLNKVFAVGIGKPQFSIHYVVSEVFYKGRRVAYSDQEIEHYNSFVKGSYQSDFNLIHDSLFGGLEY